MARTDADDALRAVAHHPNHDRSEVMSEQSIALKKKSRTPTKRQREGVIVRLTAEIFVPDAGISGDLAAAHGLQQGRASSRERIGGVVLSETMATWQGFNCTINIIQSMARITYRGERRPLTQQEQGVK